MMKGLTHRLHLRMLYMSILCMAMVFRCIMPVYADVTDAQSIKIVQETLNKEGFDCGKADGIAGNKTRAAIEGYQKEFNLEVTGTITDELLNSLGLSSDILKGALISEYVYKYNEAVAYCNAISDETGDPKINQISEVAFSTASTTLDNDSTMVSYLIDDRQISVRGLILSRPGNSYDIPMVYELVSATYALDSSFSDMEAVIDFVGGFVEAHNATSGRMNYSIVVRDGQIFFAVLPTGS